MGLVLYAALMLVARKSGGKKRGLANIRWLGCWVSILPIVATEFGCRPSEESVKLAVSSPNQTDSIVINDLDTFTTAAGGWIGSPTDQC
ncbi:hypothetical protein K227x_01720 [Rubripirellula lacrimiformis]|uniref:Uncharacterized protein n=1 Tax=Rubripirellula lacrimiformis TaxID=1930273 RepID=A0A517N3V3_9BACT|nr:hypothetical protein K227x_01720 [Rubripirellula lacrimiformis]